MAQADAGAPANATTTAAQTPAKALDAVADAHRRKEQHVPLPVSLALRLVHDTSFMPGPRPASLDDPKNVPVWIFKEVQRIKRKSGCDAWVNSGGVRGGRNLQNMSGEVVLRRRYGKVLSASDGGRRGKLTGNERRYHEYTILSRGQDGELLENRDVRLYHVQPPLDAPRLGVSDDVELTAEEEAELASSIAYQSKIRDDADQPGPSPKQRPSQLPRANPNTFGRAADGDKDASRYTPATGDDGVHTGKNTADSCHHTGPARYMAGLNTAELGSELGSMRAIALLCDTKLNPGHRPSHLGLHTSSDGLMIFKENSKRRRGRTEERWASSGGRKGARDMVFASSILTSVGQGQDWVPPDPEMLDIPQTFANLNSTDAQVVSAANLKLSKLGPLDPVPAEMAIGGMEAVIGKRAPRKQYGSTNTEPRDTKSSSLSLASQQDAAVQSDRCSLPPETLARSRSIEQKSEDECSDATKTTVAPVKKESQPQETGVLTSATVPTPKTQNEAVSIEQRHGECGATATRVGNTSRATIGSTLRQQDRSDRDEQQLAEQESKLMHAHMQVAGGEVSLPTDPIVATTSGTAETTMVTGASVLQSSAAPPVASPPPRKDAAATTKAATTATPSLFSMQSIHRTVVCGVRRRYGKILFPVTGEPRGERFHQYNLLVVVRTPAGKSAMAELPLPTLYHVYPSGSLKKPGPTDEEVESKVGASDAWVDPFGRRAVLPSGRITKRRLGGTPGAGSKSKAADSGSSKAPRLQCNTNGIANSIVGPCKPIEGPGKKGKRGNASGYMGPFGLAPQMMSAWNMPHPQSLQPTSTQLSAQQMSRLTGQTTADPGFTAHPNAFVPTMDLGLMHENAGIPIQAQFHHHHLQQQQQQLQLQHFLLQQRQQQQQQQQQQHQHQQHQQLLLNSDHHAQLVQNNRTGLLQQMQLVPGVQPWNDTRQRSTEPRQRDDTASDTSDSEPNGWENQPAPSYTRGCPVMRELPQAQPQPLSSKRVKLSQIKRKKMSSSEDLIASMVASQFDKQDTGVDADDGNDGAGSASATGHATLAPDSWRGTSRDMAAFPQLDLV